MKECIKCCEEFKDNEIVEGTDLCKSCFQEEEEILNRRANHEAKKEINIGCIGIVGHGKKNYMEEILKKYGRG